MRPEIWSSQLQHAKATLPPLLYDLAGYITDPFVSIVSTICAPQAAYFNNRLFLIGDAMCQLQPNTGQGTNFAAMDAMLLAQVFAGEMRAEEWNEQVVDASLKEQARAVEFASGLLCK
jgi:2-polyprenyl-6-methoxyphenol hydroxylase-like FAD-dependent oxidoreductase